MSEPIAFIDLQAQRRALGDRIDRAIARVLDHGQFILGPEVATLERQLAEFCGAKQCLAVANGTDALTLALMALGAGPGDAVFVPAFTFIATAGAAAVLGATPVFVDIADDTYCMSPAALEEAIAVARGRGLTPKVVIPVDLYGQPADYDALVPIARAHGMRVIADAAQSFGASWQGRKVGTLGDITTTSFFPAKPLGCYGDGGAVFTDDAELMAAMRRLHVHGQGTVRTEFVCVGINSRLDTVQAAILIEKLAVFADELVARQAAADRYSAGLAGAVVVPALRGGATSAWAQYTIRVPDRQRVAMGLAAKGIPTAVHYPVPTNRQPGYRHFPASPGDAPVAAALSQSVISLPMHPYLGAATQDRIIAAVLAEVAA